MKWMGPKGELMEGMTGPIEVSKVGQALLLMFKNPTLEDTGTYNCSAVYDNIDKHDASVQITFYQDITWEDCEEKQALVINTNGKVRCRVSANPPATVTWSKDNHPLGDDRHIVESDGVRVSAVTQEDKGQFVVRAMVSQTGRFLNRRIKVEVHEPPEIIELEEKMEATEGEEATLRCQAQGFPRPTYSWFDPKERNVSTVEGHIVDADTGTLVISQVKRDQKGTYTCLAKNPAGEAKRGLDLSVIVKPEVKSFENKTTVKDQPVTLECRAAGDPLPELSIRKQGRDRPFDDEDDGVQLSRRQEAGEAVLVFTIAEATREHDGLYYCTAENRGAHVERVGHITVEFSPDMSSTPKYSVKTWEGNPVNLSCIAEAIPNATISWSFQEQKIIEGDTYTIYGRTAHSNLLVRPNAEGGGRGGQNVYGTYKCQAENPHGTQYTHIELQEARKPTDVRGVQVVKETATTMTFNFDPPANDGGLPILGYVVKYHAENEPYEEAVVSDWSEGSPYVLSNLRPSTTYLFQFAARNQAGVGEWNDERRLSTRAESAPEAPKFITPGGANVSAYPDKFVVRWTVPLDNGRKIDYFELRYFEAEKRKEQPWRRIGEVVSQKIYDMDRPSYEMTGLKGNSFYKVEVRAHNDIGFSQDATMVFQTASGSDLDPSSGSHHGYAADGGSSLSTGAVLAIVVAILLVILIVIDVVCYVRWEWGVVHFLRSRVCAKPTGASDEKAKEAAFEDASKGQEKEPLKARTDAEEVVSEDTPMICAKDGKGTIDDTKDLKGSQSSVAKDSLV
ncbi:fasciclin-2-like isoform X2 [Uloborus diversus]|uniref:fasciclin-2-like isoform X2 n=1 Tax=Uloborus diversus TaxID=327109 RepID=UPI002409A53B|nr:fasciclin-2-like isoform X2 [Uloborus diversus]